MIYGAGLAGLQLLCILGTNSMYHVMAFLDDDLNLQGRQIRGSGYTHQIKSQHYARIITSRGSFSHFLQKVMQEEKKSWKPWRPLQIGIQVLPSLDQMIQGQAISSSLQDVTIEDLLEEMKFPLILN